jgi:phosphoribosyl 1,2-cyclic phosphodiesterase
VLASSSAGNSIFIASPTTRILIDAGLNRKEILARLQAIGEDALQLNGILLTHEHSDHVAGLPVLMKTVKAPIFATPLTASALQWSTVQPEIVEFQAGTGLEIGDLQVRSFSIPHDARDPVGFTVTCGKTKISVATDLGYVPDNVKWNLRQSQFILLESNHCPEMLKVGPYPWHLKQRILSRRGHLSNEAASEYIATELPSETGTLVLGHLSEQNNSIWQAGLVAKQALANRGREPLLVVAEPRKQSVLFEL